MMEANQVERPEVRGSLAPHTWDYNPATVPKSRDAIEVLDHDLRIVDRKLINVMLAHSFDGLREDPNRTFYATAADLKRAIGWEFKNGNREISDALMRLQRTIVVIGYWAGQKRSHRITLLAVTDVPERDGYVYWRFNQELAPLLTDPESYVNIHLKASANISSIYAHKLHEHLAFYCCGGEPWVVTPDELRTRLGATGYTVFKKFSERILKPALNDLDRNGPYDVSMTFHTGARNRVEKIEFRTRKRASWFESVRAPGSGLGRPVDGTPHRLIADTVDPEIADGYRRRLKPRTLARLRTQYPDLDIDGIIEEWAAWRVRTGGLLSEKRPADDLTHYVQANFGPPRPERGEVDLGGLSDAPRTDALRLALDVASKMNVQRRKTWMAMARDMDPRAVAGSAGTDGLMAWVPAVVAQMKVCRLIETANPGDAADAAAGQLELHEL